MNKNKTKKKTSEKGSELIPLIVGGEESKRFRVYGSQATKAET